MERAQIPDMVNVLRYGAAALMAVAFVWLGAFNWWVFLRRLARSAPSASWVPLLGGLAGVGALALLPVGDLPIAWWWPLLLDGGCAPGFIGAIVWWVAGRK